MRMQRIRLKINLVYIQSLWGENCKKMSLLWNVEIFFGTILQKICIHYKKFGTSRKIIYVLNYNFVQDVDICFLNTIKGSTLTVVRLPGASENGIQLVRSGKWKWFCDMFNTWRAKLLILNYSVLEVAANFT